MENSMRIFIVFRAGHAPKLATQPEVAQHEFDNPTSCLIEVQTDEDDGCFTRVVELEGNTFWLSVFVGLNFNQDHVPDEMKRPFGISVYNTQQVNHTSKKGAVTVSICREGHQVML